MKKWMKSLLVALTLCLALIPALATSASADAPDFSGWKALESHHGGQTLDSGSYYLNSDVTISKSITISGTVTIDLNGHVLKYENSAARGSVFMVESSGQLTITDSSAQLGEEDRPVHRFTPDSDGLWVLDEAMGTKTVAGGVITGGTSYPYVTTHPDGSVTTSYYGGGVYVAPGGKLTMDSGSIVGCTAEWGGGVALKGEADVTTSTFAMNGGSIVGCTAVDYDGGGVVVERETTFSMSGSASIVDCTVKGKIVSGGGVKLEEKCSFIMSGDARIENCKAIGTSNFSANGGGVSIIGNSLSFTMKERAIIRGCASENIANSSASAGGGVYYFIWYGESFTMENSATITGCSAAMGGSIYMGNYGGSKDAGKLYANGGTVDGEVTNIAGKIAGTGKTTFTGKVTNDSRSSTIEKGIFLNEVINNGIIAGGEFRGSVTNGENGTISGGTFTDTGSVVNNGMIKDADDGSSPGFNGEVTNNGTISGGVFNGEVSNNAAISGGVFHDKATNNGTISDGVFHGVVINNGTLTGGIFYGTVSGSGTIADSARRTVAFDTSGGSDVQTQYILRGQKAVRPDNPTREGFRFREWYSDDALSTPYTFTEPVIENLTLCAGWTPTHVHCLCDLASGENAECTDLIWMPWMDDDALPTAAGNYYLVQNITLPADSAGMLADGVNLCLNGKRIEGIAENGEYPCLEVNGENGTLHITDCGAGGSIEGMRLSRGTLIMHSGEIRDGVFYGEVVNYGTITGGIFYGAVSGSGTIADSAKRAVTFDSNGGSDVAPQYILRGQAAVSPVDPTRSGFTFGGWYTDAKCTTAYDFAAPVLEELTLTAKWTSVSIGGGSVPTYFVAVDEAKNGAVTASQRYVSKGAAVTITVTPDSGYVLETIAVTDRDGNELMLTNRGDGKYTFTMPAGNVTVKASFVDDSRVLNSFYDVPDDAYYYEAVKWAVKNGITTGVSVGKFDPDGICTRAQAVTFLWRAAGCPAPKCTVMPFDDVTIGSYYYDAVLWAVENGITDGTGDGTFSPDASCTRAQIVTFLWRSQKMPAAGTENPFTDIDVRHYYAPAVLWAVRENITNGTSIGIFSPEAYCTRAQIVTFIWRCMTREK